MEKKFLVKKLDIEQSEKMLSQQLNGAWNAGYDLHSAFSFEMGHQLVLILRKPDEVEEDEDE